MNIKPMLFGILAIFLTSSQYVASKTVFEDISVFAALGARGFLASILLIAYFRKDYLRDFSTKGLLWTLAAVVFGYFGSNLLAIHSSSGLPVEWRTLLSLSAPLWVYLIAIMSKQESKSGQALVGLGVITGAVVYRTYTHLDMGGIFANSDTAVYMLSVVLLALSYFFMKSAMNHSSPGTTCTTYLILGGLGLWFLAPGQEEGIFRTFMASAPNVLYFLYDVILATMVGYFLVFKSIKDLGVVKFTNLLFLVPLFMGAIDYVWFGRDLETSQLVAGGIIVFGVGLFQKS